MNSVSEDERRRRARRRKLQATAVIALAALLRVPFLDWKPVHVDEGINGWFVDRIWAQGFYDYDPENYHGPLHFYLLWIAELLLGKGVVALRAVSVLFSLGTVALILRHRPYLGRPALWAGLAFAVSPAATFYGRYAIHEAELCFFLTLGAYGLVRWWVRPSRAAVIALAVSLVGMLATKETWLIHLGVLGVALLMMRGWERLQPAQAFAGECPQRRRWPLDPDALLTIAFWAILALILLFSGFLAHPHDLGDGVRGLLPWLRTGVEGKGHEKPFLYWIELLGRYELLLAVGLLVGLPLLGRTSRWMRFFGLNAVGGLLAYSLVPYKTPWCIISFLWAWTFVAGYSFERLLRVRWARPPALVAFCALLVFSCARSVELSFFRYDDESEPYVYVSGKRSLSRFLTRLQTITAREPTLQGVAVDVCLESYWPLPWVLGEWPGTLYHGADRPEQLEGDLLLVDRSRRWEVERELQRAYFVEEYEMRGSQEPFRAYFACERFGAHFDDTAERFEARSSDW